MHTQRFTHHRYKYYFFVAAALILGFLMGETLSMGRSLQTSIIGSSTLTTEGETQSDAFKQDKEWLDSYGVSPNKIAESIKR